MKGKTLFRENIEVLFWVLWVVFFLLCVRVVFYVWYYGDDVGASDILNRMESFNLSFLQYNANFFKYLIVNVGRFLPVHIIHRNLVFYLFNTISLYRFYIVVCNILAVAVFSVMIKKITQSRKLFYASLILYPSVFFSITNYDDPLTSYFMFLQILLVYFSLAIILVKRYIDHGGYFNVVLAVFLYILAMLTYEISYPMGIIFLFEFWLFSKGTYKERAFASAKNIFPFVAALIICFLFYIYFYAGATLEYTGSQMKFNSLAVITFFKQLLAALPLLPHVSLYFDDNWRFIFDGCFFISNVTFGDLLTVALFILFCVSLLRNLEKEKIERDKLIFVILLALVLIFFPSIMIGVNFKYQNELKIGIGYLPVYLSRFGILLLGYLFYVAFIKKVKNPKVRVSINICALVILSSVLLLSLQGNKNILNQKNISFMPHSAYNIFQKITVT